jgi:hypothetical protein
MAILDTAKYRDRVLDKLTEVDGRLVASSTGQGFGTILNNFRTKIVRFTPVVDTSAYAANEVLFNTTAVPVADTAAATRGTILSVSAVDRADTDSRTFTFYFFRSNASLGTINSLPSITDDGAVEIIGTATVTTGTDLGGCKFGESSGLVIPFELPSNNLFVAATVSGALTFATASDFRVRLSLQLEAPV